MTPQNAAGRITEPPVCVPSAERHLEIGDRRGRAARRAAGRVRRVVRIDRRPGKAVGEFGRHRLAHDHAAGHAQQRDAGGVGERPVAAIDRRAVLGRHVDGVDDVLDPDRHAGEQPGSSGAIGGARLRQRLLRIEPGPGLDRSALASARSRQARVKRLGGQLAGRELRDGLGGGELVRARSLPCSQAALDPEPVSSSARVGVAAADQLDADRQAVRALAGRQGQTRHVKIGP